MATTTPLGVLFPRSWPVRLVRSGIAAAVGVSLAICGHRFGGGAVAPDWLLGSVFALVFATTLLLSARRLRLRQIVGLLLIGQALVHLSCAFGGAMAALSSTMILGHLVATALTAVVLARGEHALWSLARRFEPRALAFVFFPVGFTGNVELPTPLWRDTEGSPCRSIVGSTGLRGPPLGCV